MMKSRQKGISLIEILIALIVIAVGFLSLLKLQITTLNNTTVSNQRYLASVLAQDMGERIRANADNMTQYQHSGFNTVGGSCAGICAQDVAAWQAAISDNNLALPSGQGRVTFTNQDALIEIQWREKASDGSFANRILSLEVPIYVIP